MLVMYLLRVVLQNVPRQGKDPVEDILIDGSLQFAFRKFSGSRLCQRKLFVLCDTCCRIIILVAIEVNLFGSSAVFMLLASENVQSILQQHAGVDISFCYWLLVVTAVLLPLSWLGTPKDFWSVLRTCRL